jgi:hypothetical protein
MVGTSSGKKLLPILKINKYYFLSTKDSKENKENNSMLEYLK